MAVAAGAVHRCPVSHSLYALVAPDGGHDLADAERRGLEELGIKVEAGPVISIEPGEDIITVSTAARSYAFASLYPALGSDIRSGLVTTLGARVSDEGCVDVDAYQRTSAPGLYAAGDVAIGLDQISHAMGQAGVAATAIRNDLCEIEALVR